MVQRKNFGLVLHFSLFLLLHSKPNKNPYKPNLSLYWECGHFHLLYQCHISPSRPCHLPGPLWRLLSGPCMSVHLSALQVVSPHCGRRPEARLRAPSDYGLGLALWTHFLPVWILLRPTPVSKPFPQLTRQGLTSGFSLIVLSAPNTILPELSVGDSFSLPSGLSTEVTSRKKISLRAVLSRKAPP